MRINGVILLVIMLRLQIGISSYGQHFLDVEQFASQFRSSRTPLIMDRLYTEHVRMTFDLVFIGYFRSDAFTYVYSSQYMRVSLRDPGPSVNYSGTVNSHSTIRVIKYVDMRSMTTSSVTLMFHGFTVRNNALY